MRFGLPKSIFKATKKKPVKNPGSRGGKWYRNEQGEVVYGEKKAEEIEAAVGKHVTLQQLKQESRRRRRKGKISEAGTHILTVVLPDGTRKRVEPKAAETDPGTGVVVGGKKAIRAIIAREMFGEYGFKAGQFWARPGILTTYVARPKKRGTGVVVDQVPVADGFTHIEWRTPGMASQVWPGGTPTKYEKFRLDIEDVMHRRSSGDLAPKKETHAGYKRKEQVDAPVGDKPLTEAQERVVHVPPSSTSTKVAVGEPLTSKDDPIEVARKLAEATWSKRGDKVAVAPGKTSLQIPQWAVDKFDSPEHLQRELSAVYGRPVTTLITLGKWRKNDRQLQSELSKEWSHEIRNLVGIMSQAYTLTDAYKRHEEADAAAGVTDSHEKLREQGPRRQEDKGKQRSFVHASAAKQYHREMSRDLYQLANQILYEEANKYISNDDPAKVSRFDEVASRALNTRLKKYTRQVARDHGVPYHLIDELLPENPTQGTQAAAFMSPQEMFELRQYAPVARKHLKTASRILSPEEAAVFNARHWLDAQWLDSSASESEKEFHEKRLVLNKKKGTTSWERPWTRTHDNPALANVSVTDVLPSDFKVMDGKGNKVRLSSMSQRMQVHHLKRIADTAGQKVRAQLLKDGTARQVERWLRLESKLASHNRSLVAATHVPVGTHTQKEKERQARRLKHTPARRLREHVAKDPAVTFWRTPGANQALGRTLGILGQDNSDKFGHFMTPNIRNLQNKHVADARAFHAEVQAARKVKDAIAHVTARTKHRAAVERLGHWKVSDSGSREWSEATTQGKKHGVHGLHNSANAAVGGDANEATRFERIARKMQKHPHLREVAAMYRHKVAIGEHPTDGDLAYAKHTSNAEVQHRRHLEHIARYEKKRREKKTTEKSLRKAFLSYDNAMARLGWEIF